MALALGSVFLLFLVMFALVLVLLLTNVDDGGGVYVPKRFNSNRNAIRRSYGTSCDVYGSGNANVVVDELSREDGREK